MKTWERECIEDRERWDRTIAVKEKCPNCNSNLVVVPLDKSYLLSKKGKRLFHHKPMDYLMACDKCSFSCKDYRFHKLKIEFKDEIQQLVEERKIKDKRISKEDAYIMRGGK